MCLITKQSKPSIAIEDIVVYKVLNIKETDPTNISYHSYIYRFEWELGKLYETEMKSLQSRFVSSRIVDNGFHSYGDYNTAKLVAQCSIHDNVIIAEFVIPKGAKYYVGLEGYSKKGYTSNKIKMVKVMDYKKKFYDIPETYPYKVGQKIFVAEYGSDFQIKNIISPVRDLCILLTNRIEFRTNYQGQAKGLNISSSTN